MSVRLQVLFLRLGLAVVAILFLFHLYLRENRAVGQARWQTARWHQLKGGEWGAPAVSRLTMPDSGDISLQRLASLKKRTHNDTSRMGVATSVGVVNGLVEDDVIIQESIGEKENDRNLTKLASPDYQPTNLIEESSLNLTNRFLLDPSLSLPTPRATLSLSLLSHCQWLADLRHHLTTLPPSSHHLSLVSSDSKYLEVLLNWLISALVSSAKPLTNVLVLSLDHALCQLLGQREIPCVHIPPSCLLRHGLSLTHHVPFTEVHIMRLLVMRLLNNWGYDVANYDSDAVVLRNPEVRYGELGDMDLIGSVGHFPHELDHRWGTAVCIGVVLIRASPQTEIYWEEMSKVIPKTPNDQARLNWALDAMEIAWDNPHCNTDKVIMTGTGREGFKAAVLPARDVCRQTCSRKRLKEYLIWHRGGAKTRDGKRAYASKGGLWRLPDNWQEINKQTSSKGVKWLSMIATL